MSSTRLFSLRGLMALTLLLLSHCAPTAQPFTVDVSGTYSFEFLYTEACTLPARPGRCTLSPVVLVQAGEELVVRTVGIGIMDDVISIFVTDELAICDLTNADLQFTGIYDGRDITGSMVGTFQRQGFDEECSIQEGQFSLLRIDGGS